MNPARKWTNWNRNFMAPSWSDSKQKRLLTFWFSKEKHGQKISFEIYIWIKCMLKYKRPATFANSRERNHRIPLWQHFLWSPWEYNKREVYSRQNERIPLIFRSHFVTNRLFTCCLCQVYFPLTWFSSNRQSLLNLPMPKKPTGFHEFLDQVQNRKRQSLKLHSNAGRRRWWVVCEVTHFRS